MKKQELLSKTVAKSTELVNQYLKFCHSDWFEIDKPRLIEHWNNSKDMFSYLLCLRKTGCDIIILDQETPIHDLVADINRNIIGLRNEKFYIMNPFFDSSNEVSALRALSWCLYIIRDKYHTLKFEVDGKITITL